MSENVRPVPYKGQLFVLEYDPQYYTPGAALMEALSIETRLGVPVIAMPMGRLRLRGDL